MAANIAGMAFVPYYNQIMNILETNKDLKKTFAGMLKQTCYAAGGALLGAAVAGPPGGLVGGIVGSVAGYMYTETYESLLEVLKGLSDQEKEELVKKVQEVVGSTGIEALVAFVGQQVNREVFMSVIREFSKQATKGG